MGKPHAPKIWLWDESQICEAFDIPEAKLETFDFCSHTRGDTRLWHRSVLLEVVAMLAERD